MGPGTSSISPLGGDNLDVVNSSNQGSARLRIASIAARPVPWPCYWCG